MNSQLTELDKLQILLMASEKDDKYQHPVRRICEQILKSGTIDLLKGSQDQRRLRRVDINGWTNEQGTLFDLLTQWGKRAQAGTADTDILPDPANKEFFTYTVNDEYSRYNNFTDPSVKGEIQRRLAKLQQTGGRHRSKKFKRGRSQKNKRKAKKYTMKHRR